MHITLFLLELTGLPHNFTSEDIQEYLEEHGTVHDVVFNRSRGAAIAKVSGIEG